MSDTSRYDICLELHKLILLSAADLTNESCGGGGGVDPSRA